MALAAGVSIRAVGDHPSCQVALAAARVGLAAMAIGDKSQVCLQIFNLYYWGQGTGF
jgi:hypothetical protein